MKLKEVAMLAKAGHVDPKAHANVTELIRAIQIAEQNSPCFQSEIASVCGIDGCLWRDQGCVVGELPQ